MNNEIRHEITGRVKGMDCLIDLGVLIATPGIQIEEILQGTVEILSRAWQPPHQTRARIVLGDQTYETANFQESAWRLARGIKVQEGQNGMLEVFYLEDPSRAGQGSFPPDEGKLVEVVAERLGRTIDRKQTENALRQSEARYRSLFLSAPSGLFRIDLHGRVLDANPALLQILGYPDSGAVKAINYFSLCFDPVDAERLQNLLETKGVVHRLELCMTHPGKKSFWGRNTIWRVVDSSGNIIGYDGIIDDVSEYKTISKLLNSTSDHFEDLD